MCEANIEERSCFVCGDEVEADASVDLCPHHIQCHHCERKLSIAEIKAEETFSYEGSYLCQGCYEDNPYCSQCSGSGEGMYDGSTCYLCKGSGVEKSCADMDCGSYDDYEPDYNDDYYDPRWEP